jgi:hypothetical protein
VISQLQLNCPHLTEVDVSFSVNVTNASAPHLIQFTELKFLNVERTGIDDDNYWFIISKLPNIANINFGGEKAPILFHNGDETLDTITHIKSSYHDLDALSDKYPNTTNITLFLTYGDLSRLTAFNALRVLEIDRIDYDISNFNVLLRGIGHRLRDLTLSQCSRVNFQDIITLCPCLVSLSLQFCSFLHSDTPLDHKLPHFRNLINLNLDFGRRISRYIPYYSSLKAIHVNNDSIFTVELVREIIRLGTFTRLEAFHIEECWPGALTMEALQLLIGHSPRLKRIERLGHCRRLDKHDISELKRQISQQNYDLVIE